MPKANPATAEARLAAREARRQAMLRRLETKIGNVTEGAYVCGEVSGIKITPVSGVTVLRYCVRITGIAPGKRLRNIGTVIAMQLGDGRWVDV